MDENATTEPNQKSPPASPVLLNTTVTPAQLGCTQQGKRSAQPASKTTDDQVQAVCGAAALGYFKDDYAKYFVKRLVKQSPHNHLYQYLKVSAFRGEVSKWKDGLPSPGRGQLVHIGAGFDTLSLLSSTDTICGYDIDDPEIVGRKSSCLASHLPSNYKLIAIPLDTIGTSISGEDHFRFETPAMFILDGILSRMNQEGTQLLEWISRFEDATVLVWDEVCPRDTYGELMCAARNRSGRPLKHIDKYPSTALVAARLHAAQFPNIDAQQGHVLLQRLAKDKAEFKRVCEIENFQDWEEILEAVTHTTIVMSTSLAARSQKAMTNTASEGTVAAQSKPLRPTLTAMSPPSPPQSTNKLHFLRKLGEFFLGVGHSVVACNPQQSKVQAPDAHGQVAIVYGQGELVLIDLMCPKRIRSHPTPSGTRPGDRQFHQAAMVTSHVMVLYGGLTGQREPCDDSVYMLNVRTLEWTVADKKGDSPGSRWRHAVSRLPGGAKVLLFGGLSEEGTMGDTWVFDYETTEWCSIETVNQPAPRHSATLTAVESGEVVLHAGMAEERLLNDTWVFDAPTKVWREVVITGYVPAPRMSHGAAPIDNGILVLGGSTASERSGGVADTEAYIISLDSAKGICKPLAVEVPTTEHGGGNSMLLTRHSLIHFQPNTYLILGGGAHCLSYGTFLNQARIAYLDLTSASGKAFAAAVRSAEPVNRLDNPTPQQWKKLIYKKRQPVVMACRFGSCVEKWSVSYLNSVLGDKEVSVSYCKEPQLRFLPRNYQFRNIPFRELLQGTLSKQNIDEYLYYRSVGVNMRKDPADFWKTMPEVAEDFECPEFLKPVMREGGEYFSSALRVASKDITMWCHYDITDNVLFQVSGTKHVLLFPPDEVGNLYIDGSSSLAGDVTSCDPAAYPKVQLAMKRALSVVLKPGDSLFIPALWFHTTWAQEPSIGINIMFRHLSKDTYERHDLYGNKDIVPAAAALKAMEKLDALLEEIPDGYRNFYARKIATTVKKHFDPKIAFTKPEDLEGAPPATPLTNGSPTTPLSPVTEGTWYSSHNMGVFAGTLEEIVAREQLLSDTESGSLD